MATVNVTIPSPTIVAPAYFQVRYRQALLGPPVWTSLPNQTNAPFTITGVAQGHYELGVIYVNEDGESCAEILYTFEVAPPCECLEMGDVTVQREVPGGPVYITIYFTPPANPASCGYVVRYAQAGLPPALTTKASVYFATLPTPPIKIPILGLIPMDVEIISDCCQDNTTLCYSATIDPSGEPATGCEGVTPTNTVVAIVKSVSTGTYYLSITFPGPTMPSRCPGMYSVSQQIGMMSMGWGGVLVRPGQIVNHTLLPTDFHTFSTSGLQVYKPLNPSPNYDYLGVRYAVSLHDCCGNVVYFPNVVFAGVQIP